MNRQELQLLTGLALIVRRLVSPNDRRLIDEHLGRMQMAAEDTVRVVMRAKEDAQSAG